MRKLSVAIGLLGMFLALNSQAAMVGKLDLNYEDIGPMGGRNLGDGFWMAGISHPTWQLVNTSNSSEVLAVGPMMLHGINGNNFTLGLTSQIPLSTPVSLAFQGIAVAVKSQAMQGFTPPPWLSDVGNWTYIGIGGGYNFEPAFSYIHHWNYDVTMGLKIPWGPGKVL